MLGFFKKSKPIPVYPRPRVDLHSHLLPNLDDGVTSFEESLEILTRFEAAGYQKIITTPHIMGDFYKNTPSIIQSSLAELKDYVKGKVNLEIEAAAEYYLDESFADLLAKGPDKLLTLGKNFILFETGFMAEPIFLNEVLFKMQSVGLKPVLAHPERYLYLQENWDLVESLSDRGVYFQINLNSLVGYYSKPVQKLARRMIKEDKIHFLGSDCHNLTHLEVTFAALESKDFKIALQHKILNDSFL